MFFDNRFLCRNCRPKIRPKFLRCSGCWGIALFRYDAEIRQIILTYKERRDQELSLVISSYFVLILKCFNVFCDITVAPSRIASQVGRGFKHLERIVDHANIPVYECFSNHASHDQTQISDRKDIKEAIHLKPNVLRLRKNIVIFDDVWSSGNTMEACVEKIKKRGLNPIFLLISYTSRRK